MTNELHEEVGAQRLVIIFSQSSSKNGQGFTVRIAEGMDGLTKSADLMKRAKELRDEALEALKPPSLEEQFAASGVKVE